jgi:hypothetical protein
MFDGYIYMIYNTVNNDFYIGQTITTINERFKQHKYDAKTNSGIFHIIMNHIGIDNWKIIELEKIGYKTIEELNTNILQKEKEWILRLNPSLNTYVPFNSKTNTKIIDIFNDIIKQTDLIKNIDNWVKLNDTYDIFVKEYFYVKFKNNITNEILTLNIGKIINWFNSYYMIHKIYRKHMCLYKINNETKEIKSEYFSIVKYNTIDFQNLKLIN